VRALAAAVVAGVGLTVFPALASGQAGVSYQIPPDNPFVGQPGAAPEVYAMGLRNPFRFSFDRQTGDLLIGDVGGAAREEIDWISTAAARGANFGWPCREGEIAGPVGPPDPRCPSPAPAYVEPLFDYDNPGGAAVTGGYVVRDSSLTGLAGRALYADFGGGEIISLALNPANPGDSTTNETIPNLASFGEDAAGGLYVADLSQVYRLTSSGSGTLSSIPLAGPWDQPIALAAVPGDPNRMLVGERAGRVRLVVDGVAQPGAIATVPTPPGVSTGGERGLLSVAAAPDFATTGRLYVYYTDLDGDVRIDEFTAGARREVMTIEHSSAGNHNGGQLQFGPDGYLWISTGDGGGQNDQFSNAQNPATLLGKLLRIDPRPAPPPPPVVPQDAPPALVVGLRRRQRVLRRRGVFVSVGCNEPCRVAAGGRLRIGKARYRMRRIVRTAPVRTAPRRRLRRIKVRLTRRGFRALRRCARRGRLRRSSVRLNLRATDSAGLRSRAVRPVVRQALSSRSRRSMNARSARFSVSSRARR
jgi:glucose/arabinose dehydrogenase